MYWGSVRFFRHCIIGGFLLLLVTATTLSVVFGVQNAVYRSRARQAALDQAAGDSAESGGTPEPPEAPDPEPDGSPELAYQALYPDMIVSAAYEGKYVADTVYLTFDDGPSPHTAGVLDTLAARRVNATFFLVGDSINDANADLLRRMVREGHAVGVHSTTHNYDQIYQSVEAFLKDFHDTYERIRGITGTAPQVFRFPGGSINDHNRGTYQAIIAEMTRRGFVYYDWNVSAQDAAGAVSAKAVTDNILGQLGRRSRAVVLMHDTKAQTAAALDAVIRGIQEKGYAFGVLTPEIHTLSFAYKD